MNTLQTNIYSITVVSHVLMDFIDAQSLMNYCIIITSTIWKCVRMPVEVDDCQVKFFCSSNYKIFLNVFWRLFQKCRLTEVND